MAMVEWMIAIDPRLMINNLADRLQRDHTARVASDWPDRLRRTDIQVGNTGYRRDICIFAQIRS